MLIDWFTVGAQALNFLILVWLLKRFLYQPILDAIDARERRIAAALADADAKKTQAEQERAAFASRNQALDKERGALMDAATAAARLERQRLVDAARQAADAVSARRRQALDAEADSLARAVGQRTRNEVFAIARKVLADLSGVGLEERIGAVFARRLGEMDEATRAQLASALASGPQPALLRSAFEMPAAQRAVLQDAIDHAFGAEIRLQFETAPDLVGGMELSAAGKKVGWSIADYLVSLENGVEELLRRKADPTAASAPAPAPTAASAPAPASASASASASTAASAPGGEAAGAAAAGVVVDGVADPR